MSQLVKMEMPLKTFRRLERFLEKADQEPIEWINEEQARELLGRNGRKLTTGRLYNMRRDGVIPPSFYTTAVNGAIFYNKAKLMGL